MPSPYNISNIPAPRVDFIDPRTGLMAREWYRFFFNLFNLTGGGTTDTSLADLQVGPPAINEVLGQLGITYDQAQLASMMAQYEQATRDIQNQLENMPAMPQLGTLSAVNEDNVRFLGFSTNPSPAIPNPAPTGTLYWDGNSTLGLQMDQGVLAKIGQSQFTYVKASSAITKGQLVKHTGAVGGSGVITVAPTTIGMTDANQIVGVAAEDIALNGFGFIQDSGDLRGFNTTGASVGEVWADGDPLYYNPAYVGGLTNVKPSAPNLKSYVGEVINAGSGGSGSIHVRMSPGSVLGGTDANVQFGTLADKDLIQYDNTAGYWKNVPISSFSVSTATNLAGGAAGSVPYQSAASTTTFLPIGTAGQVLQVNAGATAPEWVSSTGTGNLVRANSPTLVTPALGTPSSGNFSTGTFTWPTFNQNTTGSAGSVANSVTFDNSGTGAVSGTTYNGSAARTISYNTIGAQQTLTSGTNIKTVGGISLLGSGDLGTIDVAYGGTGRNTGPTTGQILVGNSLGGWDYKTLVGSGSTSVNIIGGNVKFFSPIYVSNVNASFTGGLVSVTGGPIYDTGTLAFTVAGTSGGIPYFSSASTWASSGVLAANALVVGGGAGLAPATITTGTGVVTALGVNTGSAGAFVVNGGALGTPTSGTLTNCTGLPISTGVSGLGANVATFLATPSSANLAAAVTGETGTGALVFGSSPTIDAPTISGITNLTGGQIQFPATQVSSSDAHTLDDYDEGTWTAAIIGTTTAGAGTYTTQVGRYTKIGRVVHVNCRLVWTAHTGTGNMQISGLPFACENVAGSWFGVAFGQVSNVALTAGYVMTGYISTNTTVINLQQYPTGGGASIAVPIDTAATLVVSATYQAAT